MNNTLKTILKGRDDAADILRKLSIPADEVPSTLKRDTLEYCLSRLGEGRSLDEAAAAAIQWANEQRTVGALTTQASAAIASTEEIAFDEAQQATLTQIVQAIAGEMNVNKIVAQETIATTNKVRLGIRHIAESVVLEGFKSTNLDEAMKYAEELRGES
jgi:hypothetical protein